MAGKYWFVVHVEGGYLAWKSTQWKTVDTLDEAYKCGVDEATELAHSYGGSVEYRYFDDKK